MAKNNRVRFLLKLIFVGYLGCLILMTLLPDTNNITFETTFNINPIESIDNFFYDIKSNGIINWEFLRSKPTDFVDIIMYTFTDSFKNLAGNILLFIPLGLLYPLCRKKRISVLEAFIVIFGTTCGIELIQFLFLTSRRGDIDDVILNSIGGIIGYLIYRWIE